MAVFHVVGDQLLSRTELFRHGAQIDALAGSPFKLDLDRELALSPSTPSAAADDLSDRPYDVAFTPIGLNRPLTIQIRHVYTGGHPRQGLFGRKKGLAVVSGLKNYAVFDAASRALNFLVPEVEQHAHLEGPGALQEGTPIVAYQAAVVSESLTLTVEGAFDVFPKELTEAVSGALASAAGLPLFLPYAGYLLTASNVTKVAGNWADALFDGRPAFSFTDTLDFDVPGANLPMADFRVLCASSFDPRPFKFQVGEGLMDRASGQLYAGDQPYVVLSLDGAIRTTLEGFAPTIASASVLQRFFDMREGAHTSISAVVNALKLLSDARYRDEADEISRRMETLNEGDPQLPALQERQDALIRNITDEKMKPQTKRSP